MVLDPTARNDAPDHRSSAAPSTPAKASPTGRRGGVIAGALLLVLVAFIVLFQWNWLRAPLARAMSDQLHRPVAITGDLDVHPWSWTPRVTINGLVIGEPGWAGAGPMATVPRLTVWFKVLPLLEGKLDLPLVRAERPVVRLLADASGRTNWTFPTPRSHPRIARLEVVGGVVRYEDARGKMRFAGVFSSNEGTNQPGGGVSTIDGDLTVDAAAWAGPTPTAHVPRLLIEVRALPLLAGGPFVLPLVEADHAAVRFLRDGSGRESWNVDGGQVKPFKAPPINHLVISDGAITFADVKRKLQFRGIISSNERVSGVGHGTFRLDGAGVLNKGRLVAHVTGGPLVNVDPHRPYPFTARVEAGATRIQLAASIAHPFDFAVAAGTISLSGPDLADLYHLTGLALPSTPPYSLGARFSRNQSLYVLRKINGRVGGSDLAGVMSVDSAGGRPFVKADLASRRLRLIDLAAVVGGAPKHAAGKTLSPTQKIVSATLRAEHRMLPDTHLDVTRVRGMDAKVTYRAQSVEAGKVPIRALLLNVTLDHSVITADPLDLILPQGRLAGTIRIDARQAVPRTAIDLRLTNARLESLTGRGGANPPLEGGLFAHANLSGAGDSVRAAAAHVAGTLTLAIPGGKIRQTFAELLGIDVTKALFLLLTKNQSDTPIRCGLADFHAQGGVFEARRIILDTGPVLAEGGGRMDLRNETLDLHIQGKPKGLRLVRLGAPITLKGNLQSPKIGVDIVKAAPQALLSVAIGVLAAPAAAVLPFIHGGRPKDIDCGALMAQAAGNGVAVGRAAVTSGTRRSAAARH